MKRKVNLENVLVFVEYATMPIGSWPLPPDASFCAVLRRNFIWWFAFTHMIVSSLGWFYNIYLNIPDLDVVVPIVSELGPMYSVTTKMLICKVHGRRLQGLIAEMLSFLKDATKEEIELIESYVDQCFVPHVIVLISAIGGPVTWWLLPIVTPAQFPGSGAYPFATNGTWIYPILYCSHIYIAGTVGCIHILDFLFGMLIWCAGAKLELLATQFEQAASVDDVECCIRKHQEVLSFLNRMKAPIRAMSVEVTAVAIFAVTTGGFVLVGHPDMLTLTKYVLFECVSGLELYLYAWPADNLMRMSEKVRDAAYSCDWVGKSRKMMQDLLFTMQRSGSPVVIKVDGVLPALTLEFYGSTICPTCVGFLTISTNSQRLAPKLSGSYRFPPNFYTCGFRLFPLISELTRLGPSPMSHRVGSVSQKLQ